MIRQSTVAQSGASEAFEVGAEGESPLVRFTRRLVSDSLSPVSAFRAMCAEGEGCVFESVDQAGRWSRYSFVARHPLVRVEIRGDNVDVTGAFPCRPEPEEGPLAYLDRLARSLGSLADLDVPFATGLIGYLGYDVVREIEPSVPDTCEDDLGFADAILFVPGEVVVFDHWTQQLLLIVNRFGGDDPTDPAVSSEAVRELDSLEAQLAQAVGFAPTALVTPGMRDEALLLGDDFGPSFEAAVESAKEHILSGDIFQVVLSHRFDFPLDARPIDLYRALRVMNPSPYMYALKLNGVTVVGSSPEALVTVRARQVRTRPIAGTRPRGYDDAEDEQLITDLLDDPKERAEHVMLVDLARNDIGKISKFETCRVEEFMVPERYTRVIHLGSEVSGRLMPGVSAIDVLRATLPAGTLSGAPKVRAMQIVDDLETVRRGVYGGVVGYLDFSGAMDWAIAIRTVVVGEDGVAHLQAGAGIVADSVPSKEREEVTNKAGALARAVIVARHLRKADLSGRLAGQQG